MEFHHLQSLRSNARDPRTNAPLNSMGARFRLMDAAGLEEAAEKYEKARRRISLHKTTKKDKNRQLRAAGVIASKKLNKLSYSRGGQKTYDAGVVLHAKRKAEEKNNYLTREEKTKLDQLEARYNKNENHLTRLRLQVMELTNGKTKLAPKPKRSKSKRSTESIESLHASSKFSNESKYNDDGQDEEDFNEDASDENEDEDEDANDDLENMLNRAQMNGGDEQLPDNIQAIVDGAHDRALRRHPSKNQLSSLRSSKIKKKKKESGLRVGSKVEVYCAIGTYMGRRKTNFVKDGVVRQRQPGKYVHDGKVARRNEGTDEGKRSSIDMDEIVPGSDGFSKPEYYTIAYADNEIERNVTRNRINEKSSRSQDSAKKYLEDRKNLEEKECMFIPPTVNPIPAEVRDVGLFQRMQEAEAARRRDVKESRRELLLSTERPFEGLQQRTDAQMERKKNRKAEEKAQRDEFMHQRREERAKKMKAHKRSIRLGKKASALAKSINDKKIARAERRADIAAKVEQRKREKSKKIEAETQHKVNMLFTEKGRAPFRPKIMNPEKARVILDTKVFSKPKGYEDPAQAKIKAEVNQARRALYRARAATKKATEIVAQELRASSTSSMRKIMHEGKEGGSHKTQSDESDPGGVNLSKLRRCREARKQCVAEEKKAKKRVEKVEAKAARLGVDVTSLNPEAKALRAKQKVFAFMTPEYKEEAEKRKQSGRERKQRRREQGLDMTEDQRQELERQRRVKEIVERQRALDAKRHPHRGDSSGAVTSAPLSKRAKALDEMFDIMDEDNNMSISMPEFLHALTTNSKLHKIMEGSAFLRSLIGCDESVFRSTFASMDKNIDNKITRDELVAFVEQANETASEASLKQLLMLVDEASYSDGEEGQGDGAMTLKELNRAIKENDEVRQLIISTPSLHSLLAPATRNSAFKAIDRDGNNKVDWEELKLLAHTARQHADHEYVAPLSQMTGGRKNDVICESFEQMQKVVRTEQTFLAQESEEKRNIERSNKMSGKKQPKVIVPKRKGVLSLAQIKVRAQKKDKEARAQYQNRMKEVKRKAKMKKDIESSRLSDPYSRSKLLQSAKMNSLMWARQSSKRRKRDDDAPSSDDDVLDAVYRDGSDSEQSDSSDLTSDSDLDRSNLMARSPPVSPRVDRLSEKKRNRTPPQSESKSYDSEEEYRENSYDDERRPRNGRNRDYDDDDDMESDNRQDRDYDDDDDNGDDRDDDDFNRRDNDDASSREDENDASSREEDDKEEFEDTRDFDDASGSDVTSDSIADDSDDDDDEGEPRRLRCRKGADCKDMFGRHRREFSHPDDDDWDRAIEQAPLIMVTCKNCGKTVEKLKFCTKCMKPL